MQYNFKAIVEGHKLPTSAPLLPLFEAIGQFNSKYT